MSREVISYKTFDKRLTNFIFQPPYLKKKIHRIIATLKEDIFHPSIKTHKLSGRLGEFYACTIDYDYRLLFAFDEKYVYLLNIGSHDEVY